jgi:hypothetical protein
MHQMQVVIVETKRFQRCVNAFLTVLVPRIVELGGHPNLLPRNSGVLDALTNLVVVAISLSSVIGETRTGQEEVEIDVSMWRYPACNASFTANLTASGSDCQVLRPIAGILAPV